MPSKLKQLNIRVTPADESLIKDLLPLARTATGLDNVTVTDLIRLGLKALAREYAKLPKAKKG